MRVKKRHAAAVIAIASLGAWASVRPSNEREWTADNARTPHAEVRGDSVFIHNVRNAAHFTRDSSVVRWEERAYDLRELETAWFAVVPFQGERRGLAHTFVSFGFRNGEFLAVSVEIRRERGETYSPVRGLLKRYEIIYVVADERDVVRLRSNVRRDDVYLYPARADRAKLRAMLEDMLARANELHRRPEFYNTLTNNCTSNIVRHVNRISPRRVPALSTKTLLPGYSDQLAYELGLIDTDLPFPQARERFRINDRALRADAAPDFSQRIRDVE